ncbi:MAG: hypothetical protein ACK4UN_05795 [Limisphaerales bacterium]
MSKYIALFFLMIPGLLLAGWDIDQPAEKIDGPLTGEIFGRKFELEEAKWSKSALTIASKKKMGSWPESQLMIFAKQDDGDEWVVKAGQKANKTPHIHMKFGREGQTFPSTLIFMEEYTMRLKLLKKTEKTASFEIHVSLPDYKKSFLIGKFEAGITP